MDGPLRSCPVELAGCGQDSLSGRLDLTRLQRSPRQLHLTARSSALGAVSQSALHVLTYSLFGGTGIRQGNLHDMIG